MLASKNTSSESAGGTNECIKSSIHRPVSYERRAGGGFDATASLYTGTMLNRRRYSISCCVATRRVVVDAAAIAKTIKPPQPRLTSRNRRKEAGGTVSIVAQQQHSSRSANTVRTHHDETRCDAIPIASSPLGLQTTTAVVAWIVDALYAMIHSFARNTCMNSSRIIK